MVFYKTEIFQLPYAREKPAKYSCTFQNEALCLDIALLVIIDLLYGAGGDLLNPQKRQAFCLKKNT